MTAYRFLEPLDVLFLRGNKLFGDPGSYGEALVPPWPSVAAGAIRSHLLAVDGIDFAAFARGGVSHPALGTPQEPGAFRLTGFHLARWRGGRAETLHPLPADLVATGCNGERRLQWLRPVTPAPGLAGSATLPRLPALATDSREKPEGGLWLTQGGWQDYLQGGQPRPEAVVESKDLWKMESRIGVGLDPDRRRAGDGQLFTVQAVVMGRDVGFLAAIEGAEPPADGTLRLGGDGRAAAVRAVEYDPPEPDYGAIARDGRCRLVLTAPGVFPGGWRPPGVDGEGRFALHGVRGHLVCAAVPRAEVVSGWDLAKGEPKPAERVAPTGSVWWLEDLDATPEALRKLAESGLWPEEGYDVQRRAEGFNRIAFAAWGES